MERIIHKTSTVLISVGDTTRVYRDLREVPPGLWGRLVKSTRSANAGTIIIADEKGREEILRTLRGLPESTQARLRGAITGYDQAAESVWSSLGLTWVDSAEILLLATTSCLMALLVFR